MPRDASKVMAEDRRGAPRRNAFTIGAVETGDGSRECLVWDSSETGALIEIDEPGLLPETVAVRVTAEAPLRPATVAWREGKRVGLTFG